jgi:uncharacterized protein (TIGR03643 family)
MAGADKADDKFKNISPEDADRIVRMAWEDRTTFAAIKAQFGLTANEVVKFVRSRLETKAFQRWRKRATTQGALKHRDHIHPTEQRFKCSRQRMDGSTKGWK